MNDLNAVRAALEPDAPSQDVVDRSRHQLQNHMRGGRAPRRRIGWLVAGVGLTAAAAVAISVIPGTTADRPSTRAGDTPGSSSEQPVKALTGQEILLAAATAAEQAPEGSGEYWHVKVETFDANGTVDTAWEDFISPDGRQWWLSAKTNGKAIPVNSDEPMKPFTLGGLDLTLDEMRALPTEPDALKNAITDGIMNGDARTSGGPIRDDPDMVATSTFYGLVSLVSTQPAPPAVRAAAFRAIAAYPGVESLGEVPGGQGLRLSDSQRLVVDPDTGRVNGTSVLVTVQGGIYSVADGTARVTTEWTDTLPQ
jgi:hypothetical protein